MNISEVISKGGIYTALSIILIYLASIFPTNKLFILGICTCLIMISMMTLGLKSTITVYIATSILGLLFCASKFIVILYIFLFGVYGIVKYFIEKLNNVWLEIILKLIFFNIVCILLFVLYKIILGNFPQLKYPLYLIFIILQFVCLIYDYALTTFASYANKNIIKKI